MKKIITFRRYLSFALIRSIYINFKLLPFNQAIRLPILVTRAAYFYDLSGKATIQSPVKTGMIRLGFLHSDLVYWKKSKIFLNIQGEIIFNGNLGLGVACEIEVGKNAVLEFGNNIQIGSETKIYCRNSIKVGDNFRAAWQVQIFDSNFHFIKNLNTGQVQNRNLKVIIGENNWIGNRTSIMPGTITPDFLIITSNSICNKSINKTVAPFSIIGGTPAKTIKTGYYRVLDREEKELNNLFKVHSLADEIIFDKSIRKK